MSDHIIYEEAPDPLPLIVQGRETVAAHACGGCGIVCRDEHEARQCCAPRRCEECGTRLPPPREYGYMLVCRDCIGMKAARRERERMAAAKQVPASEYEGDHVYVNDDYVSTEVWLDDDEMPRRAWAVRPHPLPRPDAEQVAETLVEDHYEDAIDDVDVPALQKVLDQWWEQQRTTGIIEDSSRVVVKEGGS